MDRNEILRYLRTSPGTDDERLLSLVDECMEEVDRTVSPKTITRVFDCTVTGDSLCIGDTVFRSKRLAQTVHGCDRVCLLGATLGTECDRLLRTYSSIDIAKTAVLQAALASKIEEVCDSVEDRLRAEGLHLRKRYSPGYFDLDIHEQTKIFSLLDITKRIGVTLTDTMQMIPTKSVTAIIGIDDNEKN
ncbi:MAG: Vitamin B12 dependent methionine synthase activation subunit [Clostridia bacterium]|nr:Vitamin B12 dependent methionine synthase activation subunit [Clostridia bacterium]